MKGDETYITLLSKDSLCSETRLKESSNQRSLEAYPQEFYTVVAVSREAASHVMKASLGRFGFCLLNASNAGSNSHPFSSRHIVAYSVVIFVRATS